MTKIIKPLLLACAINVLGSSVVFADVELTRDETKSKVVEACQTEAKKRYGEDSIEYISHKVKWMKAMGGAAVKMKVKPEAKRITKYSCVLQQDQLVRFYKV
ncbi:hypothetical protein [uncultured Paraglaciecola sp.]|uniref:hypothetical protein n=1 Tax=uncultured Paraglaciecola sp. TaxID=1765024 RepID=UPI0030D9934A|tara:strand:- start:302232 stop:302537 length:306 start_codon:yes stop_codon:yes gene_type:complete